jgi:hypothetical protein
LKVFHQDKKGKFSEKENSKAHKYQLLEYSQPAFLDINGDMKTDIIVVKPDKSMKVLQASNFDNFEEFDFKNYLVTPQENSMCQSPAEDDYMSPIHSTSFVDLNGDCAPDIFI